MSRAGTGPCLGAAPDLPLLGSRGCRRVWPRLFLPGDQGKHWWQMQGWVSCVHPQGQRELWRLLRLVCGITSLLVVTAERDVASSEEQLPARNSVSKGKHMRGFVCWPGHVWAWSSFIYSSMSRALPEIPRWEDEEEALLWAAAFSQAFALPVSLPVSLPPGSRGCRASWQPAALF